MPDVVISAATQVLAHVPSLARHGSKPRRELPKNDEVAAKFAGALRSFDDAAAYPPHQAWIGNIHPRDLPARPWSANAGPPQRAGRFGEIMPEEEFLGLLAAVDDFELFALSPETAKAAAAALAAHPLAKAFDLDRIEKAVADIDKVAGEPMALRLTDGSAMRCAQADDESLSAHVLIDNLAAKATATLALLHLLDRSGIDPTSVDYVIGCGEEAIGDRYQRGGGNLGKAVAEAAGLTDASGADVKNFCAAFVPALVVASSLVSAGVFKRVVIVSGGSLAKLGMKFQGHLAKDLPIMEDVLGGTATLVEADDGKSPKVRLDVVGRHRVSWPSSPSPVTASP
jgi:hypothetical protein